MPNTNSDVPFVYEIIIYASIAVAFLFSWACWAKLILRLGYDSNGFLGLLMHVPLVNLIVFLSLVFKKSPNERRLREAAPHPLSAAPSP